MKKSHPHSGRLTQAYFIETANAEENARAQGRPFNVSGVLRILGVSRNGYYSCKKHCKSNRQMIKEERMDRIRSLHDASHQNYGAPKITAMMKKAGEKISEKTVGNDRKEMGIHAQYIKPYTQTTRDSDFSHDLKNILDEPFNPKHPNEVWCSDITYIWTDSGFVYLTSIMDLFSRKIIAWVLSDT